MNKLKFGNLAALRDYLNSLDDLDSILPSRSPVIRMDILTEELTDGSTVVNVELYA